MDRLKKARGVQRSTVTRIVTELQAELAEGEAMDKKILSVKTQRLERAIGELVIADQKIRDMMLDDDAPEEQFEQEGAVVAEYEEKVGLIIGEVNDVLHPKSRPGSPSASEYGSAASATVSVNRNFKLPKIELKTFNGELTEWLGWWAQFQKIHDDATLNASDKFQYLVQAMIKGSPARQLVESYPQTVDNYPKVISALQERFGSHDMLVEVYARELQKLIITSATSRVVSLSTLYDQVESKLRALDSLCPTAEKYEVLLFTMVESSIPVETLRAWNRDSLSSRDGSFENPPKSRLDFLMEFLRKEIKSEKRIALSRPEEEKKEKKKDKFEKKSQIPRNTEEYPTAAGLHIGASAKCIFCDKNHFSDKCGKAQYMSMEDKNAAIRKGNCCFSCLRRGHRSAHCKCFVRCAVCSGKHLVIMCPQLPSQRKNIPEKFPTSGSEVKTTQSNLACSSGVVLKTLMVKVVTPTGDVSKIRVLIDDGSQRTYIRRKLVEELGLELVGSENIIHCLFGGVKTKAQHHKKYLLKLKNTRGNGLTEIHALDQEEICGEISRLTAGSWMKELKDRKIWLSDIGSEPLKIDILIGADKCGRILTGRSLQLQNGLTAVETVLGWTVMGELKEESPNQNMAMVVSNLVVVNSSVEQLWDLEAIGIRDPSEIISRREKEIATKKHFLETVSRAQDGRYTVCVPWISDKKEIPDNKVVAQRRLESMTRKLKSEGKIEIYGQVFDDWLKEGIIDEVPTWELKNRAHYLPHRAVFKENSETTPVRPVFDASCKTGRTPSLNDCLEKGPNLLEEIPSLLLRFREGNLGVVSDIRKAFLMIEVKAEDRDFLRFLWWQDSDQKELKIFRHNRVVFGVNCSPFLLGAVIENHLKKVNSEEVEIAEKLLRSLYVDNCVTSVDGYSDYVEFKRVATKIMERAGMELRMWQCSSAEESGVGPLISRGCGLGSGREKTANGAQLTSVLGVQWDSGSDTLCCNMSFVDTMEKVTKRAVLSTAQKVFDPIGFLCPVLLFPKKLLQETWAQKIGWDEDLSEEMTVRFLDWHRDLHVLNGIVIPRNATAGRSKRETWQLHTFCDASKDAYACVVYLRTEEEGEVSVQLLQAKSRVAPLKLSSMAQQDPLKRSSIPRLELLGCTIGARLASSVKSALDIENVPEYFWSDSTTALAWIKRNDDWGTFVGNRVREICALTKSEDWKHVPGILNPADLPSRGCSATQLLRSKWWEGPKWLKQSKENWPSEIATPDEVEVMKERKKTVVVGVVTNQGEDPWYVKLYSSFEKIIRIVAWMKRFIFNARNRPGEIKRNQLSVAELESAELSLIKLVQKEEFGYAKNIISGIRVQRDQDGVIRVQTKILNRMDTTNFRYPILLPYAHPLVDIMISEAHVKNGHSGAQFLMGKIREKYWIIQGRRAIRKVLSSCVVCRRFSSKKQSVVPAPLPENRVKDAKAFQVTGVDLAGPLLLKNKEKVWIVLYTCAVYRCIHLEMVQSLSTEDFLDSFSRFVDRRGRPVTVYSDNGTNFVGAAALFKGIDWTKVEKETSMRRIQWIFNPPSAAWWGGWWERLIRTVKDLLKRMLGRANIPYEKLMTYLCNIEGYVNGRPLTTVTEDLEDLTPLTPAMFLHELPAYGLSDLEFLTAADFNTAIKQRKNILDELKMRFRREYLSLLVQRGKGQKTREFRVGEVVLVGDDNKKRWQWPLAKIAELFPGRDGNVRVARVKTAQGMLTRPIQRLYPLEVPSVAEWMKIEEDDAKEQEIPAKRAIRVKEKNEPGEKEGNPPEVKTRSGRQVKLPSRFSPI